MNYLDYREKLGIGFNNKSQEDYFFARMSNFFGIVEEDFLNISPVTSYLYFNTIGESVKNGWNGCELTCILMHIKESMNIKVFVSRYMVFMNLLNEENNGTFDKQYFLNALYSNLQASKIGFEIVEDDDGLFLFPKGAEEMDTALVSAPLQWLNAYPKTHAAFVKALKEYSEVVPENASDIADKFRKALETFFQEFFVCDKSLENCKGLYGGYLKSQNIPAEISANFETLLQAYTNFMNGYAKHHDKTGMNVLEYIMYQTGNIMRLLISLRQAERTP